MTASRLRTRACGGLLALAVTAAAPAQTLNLCVDAQGHKKYQQGPCPELYVNSGIAPLKAEGLTEQNVLETLKRFDTAMAKRDTRAVAAFLDEDFRAVLYVVDAQDAPPRHVDGYTRKSFIDMFGRAADVMTDYQAARSNCKVTIKDAEAVAVCNNRESAKVTSSSARSESVEHTRVVQRRGQLLIGGTEQYVSEFKVETETLKVKDRLSKD